jgi:hypothetical protein
MSRGLFLIALLCAGTAAGWAAEADAGADAKRHYDEGTKLFNLGEFGPAAAEYKAAYKAKPDPVILYNIAQALRLNNEAANAIFFYRSYLRNVPNAGNRRDVERRIRELEALPAQPKAASSPPAPVPETTATTRPPSSRAPSSEAPPAPATMTPSATTSSQASPGAAIAAGPGERTAERTPVYKKWWLWTAVGVVVLAGVGIGLGVGLSGGTHAPDSRFGTVLSF